MLKREEIDNPIINDNRDYNFSGQSFYCREEFPIINSWIKNGSKVIDLGCGNGSLMNYILKNNKNIDIFGIEISQSGVDFCQSNNLPSENNRIDVIDVYNKYKDEEFDYSVCNVTIQMLMYPENTLKEMFRISKFQIISFPNFAYFGNRLDLLFNGVMPRPMLHGYSWYNTGHIHQLSLRDFKKFCYNNNIKILRQKHLGCFKFLANLFFPNFFSKESIFLCQKK